MPPVAVASVTAGEIMIGPGESAAGRPFAEIHLVSADHPVMREVRARLEAAGVRVSVGADLPDTATQVAWLGGLTAAPAEAGACVRETFRQLREFGRRHRERASRVVLVLDTGGDFGLRRNPAGRAQFGALAGLAKTAAREWPQARVSVLDVAATGLDPATVGSRLLAELLRDDPAMEVGVGPAGDRSGPQLQTVQRVATGRSLTEGGVWVVSGGARGVTAPCLLALARRQRLRLVLLGRTAIAAEEPAETRGVAGEAELRQVLLTAARRRGVAPTPRQLQQEAGALLAAREARATCAALRAAGAEVRYEPIDIVDTAAVAALLTRVRAEWGPVRGVVHAAGVLADKALHEKTDEQFERVYVTKVDGFRSLLAATMEDPLEVLCCFSSVAARVGNVGQADYAAANEALNKLCQAEQHRRGAGCTVRAINWGPWDGGMVTPGLRARFAAMGVALIPPAAGAEVFADIVTGRLPVTVESVVGGMLPAAGPTPASTASATP